MQELQGKACETVIINDDLNESNETTSKEYCKSLYEEKELFIDIYKYFPYPILVCASDGTLLLANEAFLEFVMISNPEKHYRRFNTRQNYNFQSWGGREFFERAYKGEVVHAYDVKVPRKEIVEELGDPGSVVVGAFYHNITAFPIRDESNNIRYIVTVYITSRCYNGKEELVKGKEYIDEHWKEAFDIDKLSDIVHMSRYHYTRLFKE